MAVHGDGQVIGRTRCQGGEASLRALLEQWQCGDRETVIDKLARGHPLLTVDFMRSRIFDHDHGGLNNLADGLIVRRRSRCFAQSQPKRGRRHAD
jgi:hypothetical protein